jgi:adenylosuccinate synthase
MIFGVKKIVMTKDDVLDTFGVLQVCTSYESEGKRTTQIPFQMNGIELTPVFESFQGWKTDSSSIKEEKNIPAAMQQYVKFINHYLGVDVKFISNGPGREQIISLT